MKFLVTGGAGFIGSNLTHFLLQQGQSVVVFDDLSTGKADNLADVCNKIEFVQGDIRDKNAVSRAMTGCSGVFHLASRRRSRDQRRRDAQRFGIHESAWNSPSRSGGVGSGVRKSAANA